MKLLRLFAALAIEALLRLVLCYGEADGQTLISNPAWHSEDGGVCPGLEKSAFIESLVSNMTVEDLGDLTPFHSF